MEQEVKDHLEYILYPHLKDNCPCCKIRKQQDEREAKRLALRAERKALNLCEDCGIKAWESDRGGWFCRNCESRLY